jgi:hypothetical protein
MNLVQTTWPYLVPSSQGGTGEQSIERLVAVTEAPLRLEVEGSHAGIGYIWCNTCTTCLWAVNGRSHNCFLHVEAWQMREASLKQDCEYLVALLLGPHIQWADSGVTGSIKSVCVLLLSSVFRGIGKESAMA